MFIIDKKPFFTLGGQLHNSTSYQKEDLQKAFAALKLIHANTVAVPVMWETIEPQEGVFDFTQLHSIMEAAEQHHVKAIILWFGSWKNGMSHYIPAWMKQDKQRFAFVKTSFGKVLRNLSVHSRENLQADQKAFARLMQEIREINAQEQKIIAVQVENEPGIMGCDRDYGQQATALFEEAVPEEVLACVAGAQNSVLYADWQQCGAPENSSWQKTFGLYAGEYFTGYHLARYVERVAKIGKQILEIPMYTNVWLKEMYWRIPGVSYPSGGATCNVLDLWKRFTPSLFTIAPDIYLQNADAYQRVCACYSRQDNPLYIPESAPTLSNSLHMFSALCDYHAIGIHNFALDSILTENGEPNRAVCGEFIDSMQVVHHAMPLLTQRVGTLYPVAQAEFTAHEVMDFGKYIGMIRYFKTDSTTGKADASLAWLDAAHCLLDSAAAQKVMTRGRGIINRRSETEFILAGCGFRLLLIEKDNIVNMTSNLAANEWMNTRQWNYISVEEGWLDEAQQWHCTRKRNGDETDSGAWVTADIGLLRIIMD